MDVWINFKHATKWQAEGIFKCFFPSLEDSAAKAEGEAASKPASKRAGYSSIPLLSAEELAVLAKQFADAIPENELSVGYLDICLESRLRCHSLFLGRWIARLSPQEQGMLFRPWVISLN
jgi:hypothetical protein